MARIAFGLPALPSHAAVHGVLARNLKARGHEVAFLGAEALGPLAAREGAGFLPLGTAEGDLRAAGLARTLLVTAAATRNFATRGPEALARWAPDVVIADQTEPGASLAAEATGIPRATLAAALPMSRAEGVPPPFVDWPWRPGPEGARRAAAGWRVADALMTLQSRALAEGCRRHGLPVRRRLDDWIAPDLDLHQMVPSLDYPRPGRRPGAHAVGPLREGAPEATDVDPGDRLLVFASLGTLQGGRRGLLAEIAAAAADLGVCLAIGHAGGLTEAEAAALPGAPLARAFFPQRAILARAAACVTHGGMNTVLDCAAARVPMVVIPLGFEQPATAARLAHHGAARVVPPRRATRSKIRDALRAVLEQPSFRAALARPAAEIAAAGGVARAADLIEAMLPQAARRRA